MRKNPPERGETGRGAGEVEGHHVVIAGPILNDRPPPPSTRASSRTPAAGTTSTLSQRFTPNGV